MSDWNPAEMIGTKPKSLSLSLYKSLITDSIWCLQRKNYGYQNVLNTGNNFYHFHPGYIPEMKGADISIRSVFYRNHIGCSFFQINEKVDSGCILFREKYKVNLKSFQKLKYLNSKDFYNFWYSFIDPCIRLDLLKKLILKKKNLLKLMHEDLSEENNYFSFLTKSDIKKIYDKL